MGAEEKERGEEEKEKRKRQVWVGNVDLEATEAELAKLFADAGEVLEAKVPMPKPKQHYCKYAFVTFASRTLAQNAKRIMHGRELRGRFLKVADAFTSKSPSSGPSRPPEPSHRNRNQSPPRRDTHHSGRDREANGDSRSRFFDHRSLPKRERDRPPDLYVDEAGTPFFSELEPSQMAHAPPDEDWDSYIAKRGPPPVYYVCEGEFGDYLLPVDPRALPSEQLPPEHPLSSRFQRPQPHPHPAPIHQPKPKPKPQPQPHWHHQKPEPPPQPQPQPQPHYQFPPPYYQPTQSSFERRAPRQNGNAAGPGRALVHGSD